MKNIAYIFSLLAAFGLYSCVKDAEIETFPAEQGATCYDKIQNGTEYRIDCGGFSCAPCKVGPPVVSVTVDSTWVLDSNKTEFRYWTPKFVIVNDTVDAANVIVLATDTFQNKSGFLSLMFKIPKGLKRGVHEITYMETYEQYVSFPPNSPGGVVKLQSGIITIKDLDEANGFMSGSFEFISMPADVFKYRVAFLDGSLIDIPYR